MHSGTCSHAELCFLQIWPLTCPASGELAQHAFGDGIVHCFGCFHESDGMTCSAGAARERWAGRPARDADGADGMDVDMGDAAPVRPPDFGRLCSVLHAVVKSSRETHLPYGCFGVDSMHRSLATRAGTCAELCQMWLHLPQLHHFHYGRGSRAVASGRRAPSWRPSCAPRGSSSCRRATHSLSTAEKSESHHVQAPEPGSGFQKAHTKLAAKLHA